MVFLQVFDSEEERERSLSAFRDMAVQWHSEKFDPQIGGTTWDFSRPWSFLVVGDNWLVALHDEDAAAQVERAVGGEVLRLPSPSAAQSKS